MMTFWIMTALLTALAGLSVLAAARRGADGDETVSASAELAELDRLKARGLLDEAGWTAARAEAGRRILVSDRAAAPVRAGPRDRFWLL
ncbi:MAG: c-type cytochrome biogenesis protein CcmI, partial [Alphaproteobacteria bacterium]|nr:c-type cytochrome biogenesis protein CcmI [Alphaproteobacteria bacterium]